LGAKSNFKQSSGSLVQFYRHAYSQVRRCMHSQVARGVTGTIVCVRVCVQEPKYRAFVKMLGAKVMLAIYAQWLPHVALPARLFTKFSLCSLL